MEIMVRDFINQWLDFSIKHTVKARTFATYFETTRLHVLPSLGDLLLSEISSKNLQKFLAEKRTCGNLKTGGNLSVASVELIRIVLSLALTAAVEQGYINSNSMSKIKRYRQESRKVEAFTIAEQLKIEQYIAGSDKPEYIGVLLSLYTGLRLGELLALEWSDIDFNGGFLKITKTAHYCKIENIYSFVTDSPKSEMSKRIIPISKNILTLLKTARKTSKSKYIIARKNGKRIPTHSYQYAFKALLKKCGVRPHPFHALRHTFATRALEIGTDVKTVSELLGHCSAAFTLNRYAHSMTEYKIKVMTRLGALFLNNQKSPNYGLGNRGSPPKTCI